MIKTKRWLKRAFKELLNELYSWNREDTISDAKNLIIDYWNNTGDRSLEELSYKFESYDIVEDYLVNKLKTEGIYWVAQALEGVDGSHDYYEIDDTEGTIYCIDERDVEDRLKEIIDTL